MDFPVYILHLIFAHPFAYMVVAVVFPIVMANITKGPKNNFQRGLYINLFIGIPLNFIFGHAINSRLIYAVGKPGKAEAISSYQTSTRYNNHNVVGYRVLIRAQDGKVIQTGFADDDFNVYPSHNSVSYPQQGDRFNVRYLEHFPGSFIIITNDDSPWTLALQCGGWNHQLNEARSKFEFDKSNQQFKNAYIKAIKDYISKRCYTDSLDLQQYYGDIKAAKNAKP